MILGYIVSDTTTITAGTLGALAIGAISKSWKMPWKEVVVFNISKTLITVCYYDCLVHFDMKATSENQALMSLSSVILLSCIGGNYFNRYWFGRPVKKTVMLSSWAGSIVSISLIRFVYEKYCKAPQA